MISPEQLRIGNWYGLANPLYINSVSYYRFNNWSEALDFEAYGLPIPLSPDILEKMGFEKTGSLNFNYTTYHVKDKDCWLMNVGFELTETLWGYFIQTSANKPEWIQIAELRYVHQVQNLFHAREGQELTINLTSNTTV